ncbi:MAG TPA: hypothetical protein DCP94_12815 [Massilia timonae]|nr:hypothetical protein [Massilia timonae]
MFKAIRQVANASKHFDLSPDVKQKHQIVGAIGDPEVSDYDAYFFGDMIFIPYDGRLISMSAASALIMRYLEWVIYDGDKAFLGEMSASLASMPGVVRP